MTGPGAAAPTDELDYHGALAALADRGRFGIRLGLGRTRALLRELGDPQLTIRGALVAGTNGKGSVLAIAGSALRAAGLRVGETPKPHLASYRERVVVDGAPIDAAAFTRHVQAVLAVADRVARRHGDPTEFELLTAVVFRHFAEVDLDVALVEVGLGGRLDATHAWDGGVAVVTNVDLDHTDRLGPTIRHIAREKAAIIERGDLAVTGTTGEALAIVRRRAARMGAPLTVVEPAPIVDQDRRGVVVELPRLGATRVGLVGRHQAANAAVADALLDALAQAGIAEADLDARRRGYGAARWPGRLEFLSGVPGVTPMDAEVLLDGAHNPAGAAALATALDDLRPALPDGPVVLLMAAMADKDVAGVVAALRRSAVVRDARIVVTALDVPRALPAGDLADAWREAGAARVVIESDPDAALEAGLTAAAGGLLVVAGSLYLVGAVRARLVDDPSLHDPAPTATMDGS